MALLRFKRQLSHPHLNGLAEQAVQTVKSALEKMPGGPSREAVSVPFQIS